MATALTKRWVLVGSRPELRAALTAGLGRPPESAPATSAGSGDVVVVDVAADAGALAGLPANHVFGFVRACKERRGPAVFVVLDHGDRYGSGIARFCLADGTLEWSASTQVLTGLELLAGNAGAARPSFDELLDRLERSRSAGGGESSLSRMLRFEQEGSLLVQLQDAETGLFDGPYATLKLDEEWKRAHRFHQPLALLLLDLGVDVDELEDADRRTVLADAAGVFLNECRDIDVLARFAPTVFLFLLPGTGPDGSLVVARRMLEALRGRSVGPVRLAPACGVSVVPSAAVPDRKTFLLLAETCLQRALQTGPFQVSASWQ